MTLFSFTWPKLPRHKHSMSPAETKTSSCHVWILETGDDASSGVLIGDRQKASLWANVLLKSV